MALPLRRLDDAGLELLVWADRSTPLCSQTTRSGGTLVSHSKTTRSPGGATIGWGERTKDTLGLTAPSIWKFKESMKFINKPRLGVCCRKSKSKFLKNNSHTSLDWLWYWYKVKCITYQHWPEGPWWLKMLSRSGREPCCVCVCV